VCDHHTDRRAAAARGRRTSAQCVWREGGGGGGGWGRRGPHAHCAHCLRPAGGGGCVTRACVPGVAGGGRVSQCHCGQPVWVQGRVRFACGVCSLPCTPPPPHTHTSTSTHARVTEVCARHMGFFFGGGGDMHAYIHTYECARTASVGGVHGMCSSNECVRACMACAAATNACARARYVQQQQMRARVHDGWSSGTRPAAPIAPHV
jgi:hypothetical protein